MITRIAKRFLDRSGLWRLVTATGILKPEVSGHIGFQVPTSDFRLPVRLRALLIATAVLAPRLAWAQPFAGCGNAVPPHLATVDEEPPNQPAPVTNVVAMGTPFEISHANRVALTSMLATHLCVYMAPSVAGPPPQYVTIYIAKDDFIDPVDGDREPGHTVIHQQSNVQITAPTSGGYQLIQLLPGPVQITGPIVWLGVRYHQHNQQFVQGYGPIPPSMVQDGLAYVAIHDPPAGPPGFPLLRGDWIDYNYVRNVAGQLFLYGQRPAIRALQLIPASGACCDPNGGCVNGTDYFTCTSIGGVFQGHASICQGDQNMDGIEDLCTACCRPSGACSLKDPAACSASGGTPQLGVAGCPPGLCEGACCFSGGVCQGNYYALGCNASGGTFQGYGSTCAANPCPTPPCGNGVLNAGEQCDDGNPLNTDGCSDTCTVEPGWTCSGQPSVCTTVCGDGIVAGSEQCDDGNLINGDGCSATCLCETVVPQFNSAVVYASAADPWAVTTGDFNADGDEDIAAAHFDGTITILTNNGSGVFTPASLPLFGNQTWDVLAVDIDSDGDQDLLAVAAGLNQLGVQFNNGAGGFGASGVGHNVGAQPRALVAADFDGDCDMDIATANPWIGGDNVAVFLNTNGLFTTVNRAYVDTGANTLPYAIAAGDMNGDGDVDLVVGNYGTYQISVLHNNGAGGFPTWNDYASGLTGCCLTSLAVGDWDNDGDLDAVAANLLTDQIAVVFNLNGAGALGSAQLYATSFRPWDVIASDVNGDDDLDLVLCNRVPPYQLQIMSNDGSGNFSAPVNRPLPAGSGPEDLAAADFDGDGKRDLAVIFNDNPAVATLVNSAVHDCNQDCIDDAAQPTGSMAVAVLGPPNASPCDWTISGAGFFCQGTLCEPIGAGAFAFADDFVESINANCCPTIRATRFAGPYLSSRQAFRITAPDPNFTFCLGPPVYPTCCFRSARRCSCNPDLVLLSETDCNKNGEDDAIDLYQGVSPDENENHIPDECDVFGCTSDAECSDGIFCNGSETCDIETGQCQSAGVPPGNIIIVCSDVDPSCPEGSACGPEGFCTCCTTGDVDCNGAVDLDDILFVLDGFGNPSGHEAADMHPCGGNGVIDLDDILWVLAAFAGENLCP